MRWWSRLPLGAVVVAACGGVLNPKFNEGTDGGGESSSTSTTTATASTTSTSSTSSTTSASTSSGGESESESGASTSTTGSIDTIVDGSGTGTTDDVTTTGEPVKTGFCDGEDPVAQVTLDDFLCAFIGDEPRIGCLAPTSWAKAEGACESICGRLAIAPDDDARGDLYAEFFGLLTPEEQGMATIDDQPSVSAASIWVGACASEGVFAWIDGTPMPAALGMFGWGPQDPDEPPSSCVVLVLYGKGGANGYWHDRAPDLLYRFACEAAP
ncbi:MAG: C-type lectin domain-containing protein [Nannocystaceae bacterium]